MSRRRQRRRNTRRGNTRHGDQKIVKWALRIVSILAVVVILAGFGLYSWIKSYLRSDEFRVFMGETLSKTMGAEVQFETFEWQGMHARTDGFTVENGGIIREMNVHGIRATLGLDGVRRGVWEISDVRLKQLDAVVDTRMDEAKEAPEEDTASSQTEGKDSGFLAGFLPDRAEVSSVEITNANLHLKTSGGGLEATDVFVEIDHERDSETYHIRLQGGELNTPWFDSPIHLSTARGKYREGRIFLTESQSRVYKRGSLTLKGEVEGSRFAFFAVLRDVRSEELVPEDWQKRITGDLTARVKVRSVKKEILTRDARTGSPHHGEILTRDARTGSPHHEGTLTRGELELKNGVLTALPLLDRIAAYANTRRFRRLHLSEASLKFRKEGNRLELTDIVLASEGLVRVVGRLSVVDGRLDGRFRVGIMPGTLAHIPGAETKVFIRGEQGLLWSPLHITGTVDHPKEDLSNRMIVAAGERMFELVPETGKMALKFAHDTLTDLPSSAMDAGGKILDEGAGGVVREGTDIIREGVGGVLDLIPGAKRDEDE